MTVNNDLNSFGQDDQRVDDFDNENVSGSDYTGSSNDAADDDDELEDNDVADTYPGEKQEEEPDEIPEKHESEHESSGYTTETEFTRPESGSDASYSEQTDVTPPNAHEFPSVGNATTDFKPSNHGRTTGRMVGHEPGTEGGV